MIEIDNVLISDQIIEEHFVCDLVKCKGNCCVEGDAGAPITEEEAEMIRKVYPVVQPLLSAKAQQVIEKEGTHTIDIEYDLVTPTIDGGICAYGYYDETLTVKCTFEKLFLEGKIPFKKPISCHLFPILVSGNSKYEILNYEPREDLCKPACKLGKSLKVPVYQFLKDPLIRKYGEVFYNTLSEIAEEHYEKKQN